MKKLQIALFVMALLCQPAISHAQDTTAITKNKGQGKEMKMKKDKMKNDMKGEMTTEYPYTAEYSSKFKIGNPKYSKMILELWKDWDNGQLEMHQDYFSDTITYQTPTGEVIRGKDKFLSTGKQNRNMYSNVKSSLEVWIPLKSIDKDQDWVAVWGREDDTDKSGKMTSSMLHEIWGFNKDGKIVFFRQYSAVPAKE
jgi:hypothetical protein